MIVSHEWLKQFVPHGLSAEQVGELLSRHCVTLDGLERLGAELSPFVIAQVVAASGRRVSLHDAAPGAVERGLGAIRKSLERLAEKGGGDPEEVLARIVAVDDLVSADPTQTHSN